MSTALSFDRPNKVTVTDVGPSRKRLSIEIPAETVSEKLRESIDTLAVEAALPGFRKGRAPRQLVERRFGPAVKQEARSQLIASAYSRAIEEHKLKVVGEPTTEALSKAEIQDGRPLTFDVEVEVMPVFNLPALEGVPIRKPLIEVTEEAVEAEIRRACVNEGSLESREEPEPGDYLTGHGIMRGEDGKEHYNIKGAVIQVPPPEREGKGMILGILVDDLAAQLGRPRPGQTVTIRTTGPANHELEGVRNAKLVITFAVERCDRIVPASVADLIAKFGMTGEGDLKARVRQSLQHRVHVQQLTVMRQQAAQYLLANTAMDLPEKMTAAEANRALERQRVELMYRGLDPQHIEERLAELRAASHESAAKELKLFFILSRIADDLGLKVEEAEINFRIAQLAMERGMRPEKLRQDLIAQNRVGFVYQQIREHKALDAVIAKAAITELPAEEFNKVMEEEARKAKH